MLERGCDNLQRRSRHSLKLGTGEVYGQNSNSPSQLCYFLRDFALRTQALLEEDISLSTKLETKLQELVVKPNKAEQPSHFNPARRRFLVIDVVLLVGQDSPTAVKNETVQRRSLGISTVAKDQGQTKRKRLKSSLTYCSAEKGTMKPNNKVLSILYMTH